MCQWVLDPWIPICARDSNCNPSLDCHCIKICATAACALQPPQLQGIAAGLQLQKQICAPCKNLRMLSDALCGRSDAHTTRVIFCVRLKNTVGMPHHGCLGPLLKPETVDRYRASCEFSLLVLPSTFIKESCLSILPQWATV